MNTFVPILTCEESAALEKHLLQNDEGKIWSAMSQVGESLGKAILKDFCEIGSLPTAPDILVLLGTGHNAGDALLTAREIYNQFPQAKIKLLFALGRDKLKPLVQKALTSLSSCEVITLESAMKTHFDISIDGILGMSFHPPLPAPLINLINQINQHPDIKFRASVDIPSGLLLKADFSYATGTPKSPLFEEVNKSIVGRIRFLNIGFFNEPYQGEHAFKEFLLLPETLNPLRKLRNPQSDKRSFGHLFIISGSRNYPGALMMSVKSAITSGVGLVTVFAPESLVSSFAAQAPEAMWVPFPETESGSLSLSGKKLFMERLDKPTAILSGPGLGQDAETLNLISEIVRESPLPFCLDANALMPKVFEFAKQRPSTFPSLIATPHQGEFTRIAGTKSLYTWNQETQVTTLLKGPISKIIHQGIVYNAPYGGPILARGGSGDVLSGLIGGLLAQTPTDPFGALSKAVIWHGLTAEALARAKGQVAVRTTDLCHFLSDILHHE